MIKKLLQTLRAELTTKKINKCRKNCCDCKHLEMIPFDDFRCMNPKSEMFHCDVDALEDICKDFEEKEKGRL